jgi:hypothetical protein
MDKKKLEALRMKLDKMPDATVEARREVILDYLRDVNPVRLSNIISAGKKRIVVAGIYPEIGPFASGKLLDDEAPDIVYSGVRCKPDGTPLKSGEEVLISVWEIETINGVECTGGI